MALAIIAALTLVNLRRVREAGVALAVPTYAFIVGVRRAGRHVPSRTLLQEVWGPAYGTETNYLRVYMAQLRRKLEPDPARRGT